MEGPLRITETPNALTAGIDMATGEGLVRLLRQSDAQLFVGYDTYAAMGDASVLLAVRAASERAAHVLAAGGVVVMSGAGTSGRLAFLCARSMNLQCKSGQVRYLCAGGDKALIKAQEGAEDDPRRAVDDLCAVVGAATEVLYIGITCGFSASYVASQLDHVMAQRDAGHAWSGVLLGFNPVHLAKRVLVNGWHKSFLDVAEALATRAKEPEPHHFIINPVVGPEPITGSTRMKGGSATKVLLDMVLVPAVQRVSGGAAAPAPERMVDMLREAVHETYRHAAAIGAVVQVAGDTLRAGRNIHYVGYDSGGIIALIDASECPPTYGAAFTDVRGFLEGGWDAMCNEEGDLRGEGDLYTIDTEAWLAHHAPALQPDDFVVLVALHADASRLATLDAAARAARARGAKTALVAVYPDTADAAFVGACARLAEPCEGSVCVPLARYAWCGAFATPGELALKLVLNAITTGAHVCRGKVYANFMVDLRISNNKLFFRSISIVSKLMHVDRARAQECVMQAIYGDAWRAHAGPDGDAGDVDAHVSVAIRSAHVIPVALLLATNTMTLAEARDELKREPVIRRVVDTHRTSHK